MDLVPTVADLAGVADKLPSDIEGGSLAGVLKNAGAGVVQRSREEIVFHFPHYDFDPLGPASAMLVGDYKLIRFYEQPENPRLFDISRDPWERSDLAATMPAKTADLESRLDAYLASVDAGIPEANPTFDPTKPSSQPARGGRQRRSGRDRGRTRKGSRR